MAHGACGYALSYRLSPGAPESSLWAWVATIPVSANVGLIQLSLLLFPTGRLPSPRWRLVVWLAFVQMASVVAGAFLAGGFAGQDEADFVVESPFPDAVERAGETLSAIFFPLTTALFLASVVSLVVRYRRAVADEREQIKWFAFAAAVQLVALLVPTALLPVSSAAQEELALALVALAFTATPVVMGVAILKYRLYDIEVVINKAILLAALAAFITVVYVGVVVGVGTLVGRRDEPNLACRWPPPPSWRWPSSRSGTECSASPTAWSTASELLPTRCCPPSRRVWARRHPPRSCWVAWPSSSLRARGLPGPRCGYGSALSSAPSPPGPRRRSRTTLRCRYTAKSCRTLPPLTASFL